MNLDSADLLKLQEDTSSIVEEVGEFIKKNWTTISYTRNKNIRDVVTNIDFEAEEMFKDKLSKLLPEAAFTGEETEGTTSTLTWYVDPIDGTKEFAAHVPMFVTQVALVRDGVPILGHIHNPLTQDMFSASLENGTSYNKVKTVPAISQDLKGAIVTLDFGGASDLLEEKIRCFHRIAQSAYRVRMATPFICYLMTGAYDAYVGLNQLTKDVDFFPREIIFSEAGLDILHIEQNKLKIVCISSKELNAQLQNLIVS